jgi:hypothetical protein
MSCNVKNIEGNSTEKLKEFSYVGCTDVNWMNLGQLK